MKIQNSIRLDRMNCGNDLKVEQCLQNSEEKYYPLEFKTQTILRGEGWIKGMFTKVKSAERLLPRRATSGCC